MATISKSLVVSIVVLTILAVFSNYVLADTPSGDFPSPPSGLPASHSGGSSGGGSGYTPPAFTAYSVPIKSSDGAVIGHLDGKNYNSVMVFAEKNGTVGNATYDLTVTGELSSKPSDDCWLDISFLDPGTAKALPGWENSLILGAINVTKNPSDWGYKNGPSYTLTISGFGQAIDSSDQYYLVRSDGSGYQLQKVSFDASGDKITVKFNPPGDTGVFIIIRAPMATPTPTPTPTPAPTAVPSPTPQPSSGSMWTYPIFAVLFLVGVVAGAAGVFLLMRLR